MLCLRMFYFKVLLVSYCFLFRSHTHDIFSFRFLPQIYYRNILKQLHRKYKCGIVLFYSYRKYRHVINAIYKGATYVCTKVAFTTCSGKRDKDNISLIIPVYNIKRKDVRHCVFFLTINHILFLYLPKVCPRNLHSIVQVYRSRKSYNTTRVPFIHI